MKHDISMITLDPATLATICGGLSGERSDIAGMQTNPPCPPGSQYQRGEGVCRSRADWNIIVPRTDGR
jgi:hypothetical protein